MDWTNEIPKEPGHYFLDDYDIEDIVEIIITKDGPKYLEFGTTNIVDCMDLVAAVWLGPIKSEDIINLWKSFEEKKNKGEDKENEKKTKKKK